MGDFRQLRNKDAAARSRERRKMYVKELEMKSKYLEGECGRLGRLVQCFLAENHALRLSLQNGSACASAKQESAVLLLGMHFKFQPLNLSMSKFYIMICDGEKVLAQVIWYEIMDWNLIDDCLGEV